jgi:hypothetical protein
MLQVQKGHQPLAISPEHRDALSARLDELAREGKDEQILDLHRKSLEGGRFFDLEGGGQVFLFGPAAFCEGDWGFSVAPGCRVRKVEMRDDGIPCLTF